MQAYNECEGESMNFWERNLQTNNKNNQNRQSNSINSNNAQNMAQGDGMHSTQAQSANFNVYEHISRLNSMSEDERLAELAKTASAMKQSGSFDSQDLERVYQTAGMFMNQEQLSRLRTLIDMLKK